MEFRTIIAPENSSQKIDYSTPLFFIGSCFAKEVGSFMRRGKFDTLTNPSGVLYNPSSVAETIRQTISKKIYVKSDLFRDGDRYLSFNHGTAFSSSDSNEALQSINNSIVESSIQIRRAQYLFVTFGTARIFRFISSGKIVSNCHKIPSEEFKREILSVTDIADNWIRLIEEIRSVNPDVNIVFTVSPVRHWKDGAHGNQISKSTLFLAIDKIMKSDSKIQYFPSYELMIDDLRDYRFYNDDMLHPSPKAIEYICDYFARCYFSDETKGLLKEVSGIVKAAEHRITGNHKDEIRSFRDNILNRITKLNNKYPYLDFTHEVEYFSEII